MEADGGAAGELLITLVHGTWPRGAWRDVFLTPFYGRWPTRACPKSLWFAEDSEFRNRLVGAFSGRGFSPRVSPFLWSGANSVRARNEAAREPAERLRVAQSDRPGCCQLVIAHSHGGNVALRALDQLSAAHEEIFIATIATPFVEILPTKLSPAETVRLDLMVSATTSTLLPIYAGNIKYAYFPALDSNVLALIVGLVCVLFYLLVNRLRARNTRKADELAGLTCLSSSVRRHPLLVLRAIDDEASLALAAAATGNRLSRLLEWLSYKIWGWFGFLFVSLFVLVLVLIAINFFWPLDDFRAPDFVTRYLKPVVGYPIAWSVEWGPTLGRWTILAFFAFLFSPGVFNSAYGRELLPIFQGCEINSQSVPDSIDRQSPEAMAANWAVVVTLYQAEDTRRGLRHGLYENPQCAERIAGWLQTELASGGT